MDNSFLFYVLKLELLAFFSGYPLVYTIIRFIAGNRSIKNDFNNRVEQLLPFAYALVGTLFLGLQLKKLFPDYSIQHIKLLFQHPYLITWGLLSLLFWIPALSKKSFLSLIHSLVFFYFLAHDLFAQLFLSSADSDIIKNDMKVYTFSLLLNLTALALLVILSFLFTSYKKRLRA